MGISCICHLPVCQPSCSISTWLQTASLKLRNSQQHVMCKRAEFELLSVLAMAWGVYMSVLSRCHIGRHQRSRLSCKQVCGIDDVETLCWQFARTQEAMLDVSLTNIYNDNCKTQVCKQAFALVVCASIAGL